jgi:hypothetical protein
MSLCLKFKYKRKEVLLIEFGSHVHPSWAQEGELPPVTISSKLYNMRLKEPFPQNSSDSN